MIRDITLGLPTKPIETNIERVQRMRVIKDKIERRVRDPNWQETEQIKLEDIPF